MNSTQQKKVEYLFFRYIDGSITREEMDALNVLMLKYDHLQVHYFEFLKLELALHNCIEAEHFKVNDENVLFYQELQELAEYEKTVPVIEIPKEAPRRELTQKVVKPKVEPRSHRQSVLALAACAAVLFFIFLFATFVPEKRLFVEVATLIDQVNVQWMDPRLSLDNGSRLGANDRPLELKQGIIAFRYDNGVEVLVEGPAILEIGRAGVYLEYGQLYARVPADGSGFTVHTPSSQFIDHGTAFGVQAEVNGSSELHVLEGKVLLFAGGRGDARISQMAHVNQAVRFDVSANALRTIPIQRETFARRIDSATGGVWRGHKTIDLADIVGGGNGLGTGRINQGVHPVTGQFSNSAVAGFQADAVNRYVPVEGSRYIDGVFIPDGEKERIPISSRGHFFEGCPPTTGQFRTTIFNGARTRASAGGEQAVLAGRQYGTKANPSLMLHANCGITFDLRALRQAIGMPSANFSAQVGLSEPARNPESARAEVWVLLDGVVQFQEMLQPGTVFDLNIELDDAQFLTLVATDAMDESQGRGIHDDWCLFAHPRIEIRP